MKGFTLIELIVVLGIVGILALLSIPTFGYLTTTLELQTAASQIASDLRGAQEKALTSHFSHQIVFRKRCASVPRTRYIIKRDNLFKGLEEVRNIELSPGLDFKTDKTLKFSPTGFPPPGGSGTVILQAGTRSKRIILSSLGRVRIE